MNTVKIVTAVMAEGQYQMMRKLALPPHFTAKELANYVHIAFNLDSPLGTFDGAHGKAAAEVAASDQLFCDCPPGFSSVYYSTPDGHWDFVIYNHGEAESAQPAPFLMDAVGPDILPSAKGPDAMTVLRHTALLFLNGFDCEREQISALTQHFPGMGFHQIYEALSCANLGDIAQRFTAFHCTPVASHGEGPWDKVSKAQHKALEARLDNPGTLPAMSLAQREAFGRKVHEALKVFHTPVTLTSKGNLPLRTLRALAEALGVHPEYLPRRAQDREQNFSATFLDVAEHCQWIHRDAKTVVLQLKGYTCLDQPLYLGNAFVTAWAQNGTPEHVYALATLLHAVLSNPADTHDAERQVRAFTKTNPLRFLEEMGMLQDDELTAEGTALVGETLRNVIRSVAFAA